MPAPSQLGLYQEEFVHPGVELPLRDVIIFVKGVRVPQQVVRPWPSYHLNNCVCNCTQVVTSATALGDSLAPFISKTQ